MSPGFSKIARVIEEADLFPGSLVGVDADVKMDGAASG